MTTKKPDTFAHRLVDWIALGAIISGVVYGAWHLNQEAAKEREEIRQTMIREFKVRDRVMGTRIEKSKLAAWVSADTEGNVVALNDKAKEELNLKIGDSIEKCMRGELKDAHRRMYKKAMVAHLDGNPYDDANVGFAQAPDGEWHRVHVEFWTVVGGSQSFLTRIE